MADPSPAADPSTQADARHRDLSSRQLVLLCDGTNNNLTGGERDTHVVLLAELLRADPDPRRVVWYDPGVGNPADVPGTTLWDKASRLSERVAGLAFGRGVFDNVAEGYRFLMRHWQGPSDRIFVIGFSRGAFTARSIAGLVNRFGILDPQFASLLPTLLHLYFADDSPRVQAVSRQVSRLFEDTASASRRPDIWFVGVWDTVATVGLWPAELRIRARPTLTGKRFVHVRQALALDELRAQFKPRAYAEDDGPVLLAEGRMGTVLQRWFRGAHADVGGGYRLGESAVAREPLAWLVAEAVDRGLRLHADGVPLDSEHRVSEAVSALVTRITGVPDPVAAGAPRRLHSQLAGAPLWTLSGLAVRDTTTAAVDGGSPVPVRTAEHPSVAAWIPRTPAEAGWPRVPLGPGWWLALLLCVLIPVGLGHLAATPGDGSPAGAGMADTVSAWLAANLRLQAWQAIAAWPFVQGAWNPDAWWAAARAFGAPAAAVGWDFALITAYAVVLAPWVARAFAWLAGCRRHGQRGPIGARWLGWALPLLVAADVVENLATLAALAFGAFDWLIPGLGMRLVLSLAVLAKAVGALGVGVLLLRGIGPWPRPREDGRAGPVNRTGADPA